VKFPRRTLEDPAINLTPLIDVVFLLLIFFMVTTTFTRETRLAVDLPEAEAGQSDPVNQPLEVLVSESGSYSINDERLMENDSAALRLALLNAADQDTGRAVLLIADAEATHQSVVTAMDAIGQAGFSQLSIATRQPAESDINVSDGPSDADSSADTVTGEQ
jgi:biopolymer transport protein ExbD